MTVGLPVGVSSAVTTNQWQFLKLGNGGLIDHIDRHPDGTMVCGTDSFGFYVWDYTLDRWVQCLDITKYASWTQEGGGCDDIKIDPSNSNNIWVMFQQQVFKSTDKGATFAPTSFSTIAISANQGHGRTNGPFLAIDPNNGNVVYVSTTNRGCWRTTDGGSNWTCLNTGSANVGAALRTYENNNPTVISIGTDTSTHVLAIGSAITFNANSGSFGFGVNSLPLQIWSASNKAHSMVGTVTTASSGASFAMTPDFCTVAGTSHNDWVVGFQVDEKGMGGGHLIAFYNPTSGATTSTGLGGITRTATIYISTYGAGVFVSTDGGVTFSLVTATGMPTALRSMAVDPFGVVWAVTDDYPGATSNRKKYTGGTGGTWSEPITGGYGQWYTCVNVDRAASIAAGAAHVCFVQGDALDVDYTADGGANWNPSGDRAFRNIVHDPKDVDWMRAVFNANPTGYFATCCIVFDTSGQIWMGGEGVWRFTPNPVGAGRTITITQQSRGIEEFIGNNIISLPNDSGKVIASTWDFPCFKTGTLSSYPSTISGTQGPAQTGLSRGYCFDYVWNKPNFVVGVFQDGAGADTGSGFSRDYGEPGSWQSFTTIPSGSGSGGHIAAADDHTFVWVYTGTGADGTNHAPVETTDGGKTWTTISIPGGTPLYGWQPNGNASTYSKSAESDKTNGDIYVFNVNTGATSANPNVSALFKRTAATGVWSIVKSPFDFTGELNFNGKFRAVPSSYGLTGHMWFTGGHGASPHPNLGRPLYYTTNGWSASNIVANFTECAAVGFGASFPGHTGYPTIFVAGWLSGVYGIWMCKDFNTGTGVGTWTKCGTTYPMNIVGICADIDGDKTIAGQVYVQTTASGAFWGRFT